MHAKPTLVSRHPPEWVRSLWTATRPILLTKCLVVIPTDVIPVQEDAGIPPLSANGEGV